MKQIKKSPISGSQLKPYISCVDYTVSRETFSILEDAETGLLVTSPRPEDDALGNYYESEAYISHTDAKTSITDKIYQTVKHFAINKKLDLVQSFETEGKNLLDVGCGTGDFLAICNKDGWTTLGVEPNSKARTIARNKSGSTVLGSITEIQDQTFDVITLWHVLEHIPNLDKYTKMLRSLLKPNGILIIAVPNHKSYDARYYKEYWAAYDVPRHLWHFSQNAIVKLFEKINMCVVKIRPMYFDSFYVSLLSEKYKYGRQRFLKAFCIGLLSNFKALRTKEFSSLIYIIKNR